MSKKGQVTLFIVLAVVLAAIIVLFIAMNGRKLTIDISGSPAEKVQDYFEECLASKLSFGVVRQDFLGQPRLFMAKQYLESYMNAAAVSCSEGFSQFDDLIISGDKGNIRSTAIFDGDEFDSITKVSVEIYYPINIKKGGKEYSINKFEAGVKL